MQMIEHFGHLQIQLAINCRQIDIFGQLMLIMKNVNDYNPVYRLRTRTHHNQISLSAVPNSPYVSYVIPKIVVGHVWSKTGFPQRDCANAGCNPTMTHPVIRLLHFAD